MAIIPTRSTVDTNSSNDVNELSVEALDKGGTSQLAALTEETSPGANDLYLMERSADGLPKKVKHSNIASIAPLRTTIMGDAYVANNIIFLRATVAFDIDFVRIGAGTAPTGANLIVDIHYHATDPTAATTIFTTQGNRPEIAAAAYTADSGTPDIVSIAAGGFFWCCIDQMGSTIVGAHIPIEIIPV